jgi:hypothetical protein
MNVFAKILRFVAILLFGLTVAFHVLGGIGTSCVALAAESYDSMVAIAPYKWLYQLFVVVTLAVSIYGLRAMIALIRGKPNAYRDALIFLVLILLVSGVHMGVSQALRGKSAPTNMRVYFTLLTLAIFLLLRIPGVWEAVDFSRRGGGEAGGAAGMAMILSGAMTLSVGGWAGPSHIMNGGINYADAWRASLGVVGWGLALAGAGLVIWACAPWIMKTFALKVEELGAEFH